MRSMLMGGPGGHKKRIPERSPHRARQLRLRSSDL